MQNDPLYTVIDTISYPVQKIPFPAVTVCPPGLDRHAFIEKFLNYVKFQCYNDYEYSANDCMESKDVKESFKFLLERIHKMALDATIKNINLMSETELQHELLQYIEVNNGTSEMAENTNRFYGSRFLDITEDFFGRLLFHGASNQSTHEKTEEKLTNFILDAMGRIHHIEDYLTELKDSIVDEERNDTMMSNITIVNLTECVNHENCGYWLKLGLAYIDLFELYGNHKVWDLGSMVVYSFHILEINPWEPSKEELQLDSIFQNIFRSISSSNSNLSAYDIIALLGFDSNGMKPKFLPNFPTLNSIWNESNFQFIYGQDGTMEVKRGCYVFSYQREWKYYMENPEQLTIPCDDKLRVQQSGFEPCCRIKKELDQNMYDIIQMSKYTQYPPHKVDQNEPDAYDLLRRSEFINSISSMYPLYDHETGTTNSDREISEPLIPFCAFDSEWETIPYGAKSVWDGNHYKKVTADAPYCNSFRPSFTDRGICYSWNSMKPSSIFSASDYIQHTDKIFQYKENKSSVMKYPNANGPNFGFRFIVDTHTFSSNYKQDSNVNKDVEIVLHEGTEIPYFKYSICSNVI